MHFVHIQMHFVHIQMHCVHIWMHCMHIQMHCVHIQMYCVHIRSAHVRMQEMCFAACTQNAAKCKVMKMCQNASGVVRMQKMCVCTCIKNAAKCRGMICNAVCPHVPACEQHEVKSARERTTHIPGKNNT